MAVMFNSVVLFNLKRFFITIDKMLLVKMWFSTLFHIDTMATLLNTLSEVNRPKEKILYA